MADMYPLKTVISFTLYASNNLKKINIKQGISSKLVLLTYCVDKTSHRFHAKTGFRGFVHTTLDGFSAPLIDITYPS